MPVPAHAAGDVVGLLRAAGCVFAEEEARLLAGAARTAAELAEMAGRRAAGMPLEHVLGWAEFCGLRISVDQGVFVPRRRTEHLARLAGALAGPGPIVDLACGSGAVGLAVATLARSPAAGQCLPALCQQTQAVQQAPAVRSADPCPPTALYAVDIDQAAVACAARNLAPAGGQVYQGDLYAPLPAALRGQVTVLVANVPYVPSGEVAFLPPEARLHEPLVALDGGADGLDVLRQVAAGAGQWLLPGGHLLLETSQAQAPAALAALSGAGLAAWSDTDDGLGATVIIGRLPARR